MIHLNHFFSPKLNPSKVRWMESQTLKTIVNVHLIDADLDVSEALAEFLFSKFPTIILCSATLTSNQQFDLSAKGLAFPKNFARTDNHRKYLWIPF